MATVRKRKLPSGATTWQADYRDASGKRRHKQFRTRKEADEYLTKAKSEVGKGVHVPDSQSLTIAVAGKRWLDQAAADGLERSTIEPYRDHLNQHIGAFIGAKKLTQLTTPGVYDFIDKLKAAGRSEETIRRVVQTLGRIYKFAKGRGLAGHNPVADVQLRSTKRGKKRPVMPSREELKKLINTASGRWRPLIITAVFTGLRASELRGLRWADVDFQRRILTVNQRADAWKRIGPPKTAAGHRDVPLPPMVVNALKEWKLACPNGDLDLVFPNGSGKVEDFSNIVNRGWNPLQIETEIVKRAPGQPEPKAKYNFHVLRHAAAALFIEQSFNPKRVQTVMGHSSIQVTYDLYGYLFEDEEKDQAAMEQIEKRLLS